MSESTPYRQRQWDEMTGEEARGEALQPISRDATTLWEAAQGAKIVPPSADDEASQPLPPGPWDKVNRMQQEAIDLALRRQRELAGALVPPRGFWLGVLGHGYGDGMIGPYPTHEAATAALDNVRIFATGIELP